MSNVVVTTSHRARRSSIAFAAAVALATVAPNVASAQSNVPGVSAVSSWEFRLTGGAFLPTGEHRHAVSDAHVSALQVAWVAQPAVAITSTVSWARSRDVAAIDTPKLDVFTADFGVEARAGEWFADGPVGFRPFAGVGAGARFYDYRNLHVDATTNLAGYLSVGGEVGMGRVGLRVEVRDYVAGFEPLAGIGASGTRNDVAVLAALRFNRQRASAN